MLRTSELVTDECERDECAPLAPIPAWWSAFLFHALNPRQVCMYLYLTMISDERGRCSPTIEEIRQDLGLYSTSMVFEALSVLEGYCFITRERTTFPGTRAKRNTYHRPACEKTILRLLERNIIDGQLSPIGGDGAPASARSKTLVVEGLCPLLGDSYERYAAAPPEAKRTVLMEILQGIVDGDGAVE